MCLVDMIFPDFTGQCKKTEFRIKYFKVKETKLNNNSKQK